MNEQWGTTGPKASPGPDIIGISYEAETKPLSLCQACVGRRPRKRRKVREYLMWARADGWPAGSSHSNLSVDTGNTLGMAMPASLLWGCCVAEYRRVRVGALYPQKGKQVFTFREWPELVGPPVIYVDWPTQAAGSHRRLWTETLLAWGPKWGGFDTSQINFPLTICMEFPEEHMLRNRLNIHCPDVGKTQAKKRKI